MATKSIQYNQRAFDVSYEIVNPLAKVDFIVLHGWGSNKNLMKQSFAPFNDDFRHIYIDLPGFGSSTCDMPLNTSDVANIVALFLQRVNSSKEIILGHSFGGKVALLLKPKLLVLVASAGIYVKKSFKVRAKIKIFKLLKIFGLSKFRSFFVADDAKELSENMYQTFKNVVNEDFSDEFSKYEGKALLCWGKDDAATPISSARKIDALLKNSKLEIYDGDHYFFMKNAKDISKKIELTFLTTLEH